MTQEIPIKITKEPTIGSLIFVTQEPVAGHKISPCHELGFTVFSPVITLLLLLYFFYMTCIN
jgi:hypothetical protein